MGYFLYIVGCAPTKRHKCIWLKWLGYTKKPSKIKKPYFDNCNRIFKEPYNSDNNKYLNFFFTCF